MLVEENVERDAVHKALLSLLRQDVKGIFFFIIYGAYQFLIIRLQILMFPGTVRLYT